jgi:hypothetical protein
MHHGLYGVRWKSSNGALYLNEIGANYVEVTPLQWYMEGPLRIRNVSIAHNDFTQCGIRNAFSTRNTHCLICPGPDQLPFWARHDGHGGACNGARDTWHFESGTCMGIDVANNTAGSM